MKRNNSQGIFISPELFESVMRCLNTTGCAWSTDLPSATHDALIDTLLNGTEEPASIFDEPGFMTWACGELRLDPVVTTTGKALTELMIRNPIHVDDSFPGYPDVASVATAYAAHRDDFGKKPIDEVRQYLSDHEIDTEPAFKAIRAEIEKK